MLYRRRALESSVFENRQNDKKVLHLGIFGLSKKLLILQNSSTFNWKTPFRDEKLSVKTFMEETKSIVMNKREFGNREM